jgi:hypothetical protein
MQVRQNVRRGSLALVGLLAIASAAGRTEQDARSRVLLASVADPRNQPLVDLGPDDFVVTENGQNREVFSVYPADYPVAILIDNSAAAEPELEAIRPAVKRFVSRVSERLVALGVLASPADMITSFEDSRALQLQRIDEIGASASVAIMPLEAVSAAIRTIGAIGTPFSAIVVVSAHAESPAPPNDPQWLNEILETRAVLHVVRRGSPAVAPAGPPPPDVLRELADRTRGSFTTIFSAASYSVALNSLADRLATEMMIEYLVPAEAAGEGGGVELGVRIPGAKARGLGVSR